MSYSYLKQLKLQSQFNHFSLENELNALDNLFSISIESNKTNKSKLDKLIELFNRLYNKLKENLLKMVR